MNTHLSIPFEVRFFSGMFKLPSLGKLFSTISRGIKDQYVFVNFALLGYKENLLKNLLDVSERDIRDFQKLKELLGLVSKAIKTGDSQFLLTIKQNTEESIVYIDEIVTIIEEKLAYKSLKSDLYQASGRAVSAHLAKYN
jgi:hypothetical protein